MPNNKKLPPFCFFLFAFCTRRSRRTSWSSLIEVMVMMVILSIAIVGIYSLVNSGQRLAQRTEEQLTATNMARAGLERVVALRDTFVLRAYIPGPDNIGNTNCFFTADGKNYASCPLINTGYYITDESTLWEITLWANHPVCINENGWYSQEFSNTWTACTSTANICGSNETRRCRTRYSRKIVLSECIGKTGLPMPKNQCINVTSTVTWWNQHVSLEQVITKR